MDYEKEIPFGAFDSELMHQEIFIPEGFEATIDGNKIILKKTESEDEKIRKAIIELVRQSSEVLDKQNQSNMLAWLEKQGNIDKASYEIAEKEKREFVGDSFIKCYSDFQDFKEEETYWLEYVGNDNYNVRSDNLLGKTYHITPCQLYTIFKKTTWLEKQGEHKFIWDENDDWIRTKIIKVLLDSELTPEETNECIDWLKFLKQRIGWKPSEEQITVLELASKYERVFTPKQIDILINLKEQLKKLKGH